MFELKAALDHGGSLDTFKNFNGCYNIQFKAYAK